MPSVVGTLFSPNNRCYLYGAIVSVTAIGILHFKGVARSRYDEIQTFSQKSTMNRIDLITTELPLFIAPFAGIDCIHYLTEMAYRTMKRGQITRLLVAQCAVSGGLGIGLPISFLLRNKHIAAKSVPVRGLRNGMRRFMSHSLSITVFISFFGSFYRFIIASMKYVIAAPLIVIAADSIVKSPQNAPKWMDIHSICHQQQCRVTNPLPLTLEISA